MVIFGYAIAGEDIVTYKSLTATCSEMRRVVSMLHKPQPIIQLDSQVADCLNITSIAGDVVVSYKDLVLASGTYSPLTCRLNRILGNNMARASTMLVIHPVTDHVYQGYRLSNILQFSGFPALDVGELVSK